MTPRLGVQMEFVQKQLSKRIPLFGQAIDIGCLVDLAAVSADGMRIMIVGHYIKNVRPLAASGQHTRKRGRSGRGRHESEKIPAIQSMRHDCLWYQVTFPLRRGGAVQYYDSGWSNCARSPCWDSAAWPRR